MYLPSMCNTTSFNVNEDMSLYEWGTLTVNNSNFILVTITQRYQHWINIQHLIHFKDTKKILSNS